MKISGQNQRWHPACHPQQSSSYIIVTRFTFFSVWSSVSRCLKEDHPIECSHNKSHVAEKKIRYKIDCWLIILYYVCCLFVSWQTLLCCFLLVLVSILQQSKVLCAWLTVRPQLSGISLSRNSTMHHTGKVYSYNIIIKSHEMPSYATEEISVEEKQFKDTNVTCYIHNVFDSYVIFIT